MTRHFANLDELANALADDVMADLHRKGIEATFGASNLSCAKYIEVEGNGGEVTRLRFSDHKNVRSGPCTTIRIEGFAKPLYAYYDDNGDSIYVTEDSDEYEQFRDCCDFVGFTVSEDDYSRLLKDGLAALS